MQQRNKVTPKIFILDVDGVMTDGRFYYTEDGKVMKSDLYFKPNISEILK